MNTLAKAFGRKTQTRATKTAAGADLSALVLRLRMVSNGCLFVAIFAVPMTSACLQESGILLFAACSLVMGLAWAIEQILEPSDGAPATGAEFIMLGAVGLIAFQLMSLPPNLLKTLAPFSSEYLTLWGSPEGRILGSSPWTSVSMTPSLTRSGLLLLVAYTIFFFTLVQKLRTTAEIDRLIRHIAIATTAMAVIGIAQLFFGNGQFLWMFDHPFRTASWPAKGAFSNQNHFAHFLALGIGPLVWCWRDATPKKEERVIRGSVRTAGFGMHRSQETDRQIAAAAIAVVMLAGVLSFSRGGIVAIGIATLISLSVVYQEWKRLLKLALPIGTFVVIAVWLFGAEYLAQKFATIRNAGSISELLEGRLALWSAIWEAVPSFRIAGSGLGSHAEIYPTWLDKDFGVRFSHAESGYLQVLLETGIAGITLLAAALMLVMSWIVRTWRRGDDAARTRVTVLAGGIIVSILHSVVDFVWYIPGCMVLTLTIAACLCRCFQLQNSARNSETATARQRPLWPQLLAWLIILIAVPYGKASAEVLVRDAETENDWNQYRRHAIAAKDESNYQSLDSLDDRLDSIILHLENCLARDPSDYRAASDLSAMYLRRFERHQTHADNRVNIREIRSTVRSVEFESAAEIAAWLKRAFDSNASDLYRALALARRAVRGQPARGETYLVLAQVAFLAGVSEAEEAALLEQAVRLRPYKAGVLYFAGLADAEAGNLEAAMQQWKAAFQRDVAIRPMIIQSLSPYLSASELIEQLSPGPDGIWRIFSEYQKNGRENDVAFVAELYTSRFEELAAHPERGRFFWRRSADIFGASGNQSMELLCLTQAVNESPTDYNLRKTIVLTLLERGQKEEALPHLSWCQARNPDDKDIAAALIHLQTELTDEVNSAK